MKGKKRIVFLISGLILGASLANAQDASSIVHAARNRIDAATESSRSRMVITAKNGTTTERAIDQYSKEDAQGNDRMVIVFQSPASVKGTRFLTIDKALGDSDRWIVTVHGKLHKTNDND